jgi:hypothetical protein
MVAGDNRDGGVQLLTQHGVGRARHGDRRHGPNQSFLLQGITPFHDGRHRDRGV